MQNKLHQTNFELCLAAAGLIVQAAKKQLSPGAWLNAGGWSAGSSGGSNTFVRKGTSSQTSANDYGSLFNGLLPSTATKAIRTDMRAPVDNFLGSLLQRDNNSLNGQTFDTATSDLGPSNGTGMTALSSLTGIDPTSDEYRQNTFDKYMQSVKDGLAAAQTGPNNVRGGQARQGFREADVVLRSAQEREDQIRQQRQVDAGIVTGATGTLNQIELGRRNTLLEANRQGVQNLLAGTAQSLSGTEQVEGQHVNEANILGTLAKMFGVGTSTSREDMAGAGSQTASQQGGQVGVSCCYIYLEAFNGTLPDVVRRARDLFAPDSSDRRIGYVWMSKWLVPAMQKLSVVRWLVNNTMVKPSIKYATWFFNEDGAKSHWRGYKAVVLSWFKAWELIGKVVR